MLQTKNETIKDAGNELGVWVPTIERLPKYEDADCFGNVWCFHNGCVYQRQWDNWPKCFAGWSKAFWQRTNLTRPDPPITDGARSISDKSQSIWMVQP